MSGPARAATASPVLTLEVVDSTNAEAMRRAVGGERGPLWITARRQTAGRGRAGRAWCHADGNLAASLLFSPEAPVAALHQLSLLAGIAVHDAISACGGGAPSALRLKWPNDVLIAGAKVGGILVETTTISGRTCAVIGIGINVASAPPVEGRSVASLTAHSVGVTGQTLLAALDRAFQDRLALWQGGAGFERLREAWLARAGAIGERLSVQAGQERLDGAFGGLDADGALLLGFADGTVRRLTFGDVSLVAAPTKGPSR